MAPFIGFLHEPAGNINEKFYVVPLSHLVSILYPCFHLFLRLYFQLSLLAFLHFELLLFLAHAYFSARPWALAKVMPCWDYLCMQIYLYPKNPVGEKDYKLTSVIILLWPFVFVRIILLSCWRLLLGGFACWGWLCWVKWCAISVFSALFSRFPLSFSFKKLAS